MSNPQRGSRGPYRIRVQTRANNEIENYSITVPHEIAGILPRDMRYTAELTDEGILFRPVKADPTPGELPGMGARMTRFLRKVSDRSFEVHDDGVVKGMVWTEGGTARAHNADAIWRNAAPNGVEWRAWRYFATPQDAARACVREYDAYVARHRPAA